jgi:hypothetical protein
MLKIQLLRWRFDIKTPTGKTHAINKARVFASCNALCDRRNFKKNGIAKDLTNANPSWACAYAPKMEEFCRTNSPTVCRKTVGSRGFPGGTPGRVFLVRSLPRGKE